METEATNRRCKACGKLLLDERLPFCRRCILQGRNIAGRGAETLGSLVLAGFSANALKNNFGHNSGNDKGIKK